MHKTAKILLLLFPLAFAQISNAQTSYHAGSKPDMTLYGSSTLHNWTMDAHTFAVSAQFTIADNQLTALNALMVVLPVHNLKSDHSSMDDNAYDALKADKYKDIVFKLTSATVTPHGSQYQIAASGNLTIAGATKAVTLNTTAVLNADGSISCSGTLPLKLSEFNIDRPSFMLGTMKVGDGLTLNYSLVFVK